ncbi:site-specific integrase [Limosilactobacillus reuteri]|uniref:tyrosine-type recombinase/integrase n=1 Tax=Limosilactobacillus reuteri TaxID=1598 RepID=UPI0015F7ACEB|nr:tyrosine-type recombinase/integrase [Limosilactobacillus reuteri]MBB1071717.1 tyrosine-type recombinase/integrase [Limosilactobacillus reuteri]MCC4510906.1 site-specific integrase [Limosilactobacillus reuteri]MCC4512810.1 site-specific integrase [Limosilactobacillus reuteri]MCC4513994.1 site-specific integrase [Limosilactobacillus reuteri]
MIKKMTTGKHKGEYQVRIQPINKITGKRESWPVDYASNRKTAKSLERQMWADYEEGLQLADGSAIFADEFQKYIEQRKNTISLVTYRDWDNSSKEFKKYFKNTKIRDVTERLVEQFAHDFVRKHKATVGRATVIDHHLTHMRSFFKELVGKVIKENPVPEQYLDKFFRKSDFSISKQRYLFTNTELKAIKAQIQTELNNTTIANWGTRLAIWIDLETGMRPGEIQALRFKNITAEDGYPTFKINDSWSDYSRKFNGTLKARPKGYSRYCLPISQDLVDFINTYNKQQKEFLKYHGLTNPKGLIFLNLHDYKTCANNIPITQKSMNEMLKKICGKLNISGNGSQLSMYSFRHTLCTKLANKPGISYPWAAERMGNSLSIFMRVYVKADRDINRKMMDNWMS